MPEAGRLSVDPDQKICDGVAASVGDEDEPLSMHRLIGCQGSLFVTANPCIPRGGEEKAEVVPSGSGLEVAVRPEHVDLCEGQRPYEALFLPVLPALLCHVNPFLDREGHSSAPAAEGIVAAQVADSAEASVCGDSGHACWGHLVMTLENLTTLATFA